MARVKGGYLSGIYDIPNKQPLDSRMLVTKRADLINPSIWKTNGSTTGEVGHYSGMIVAVNSDGEHNGVYYLIDRKAITAENYSAYKTALDAGEDVNPYFSMWMKLGTLNDLASVEKNLKELIGEMPEGKTVVDMLAEIKPSFNLIPIDGTMVIADIENGDKTIAVAIAQDISNALVAVDGGLFVPTHTAGDGIEIVDNQISVKLSDTTHGLVAVDGALTINLATTTSDGAMSKEDKIFLNALKELNISSEYATKEEVQSIRESVAQIEQVCVWAEM